MIEQGTNEKFISFQLIALFTFSCFRDLKVYCDAMITLKCSKAHWQIAVGHGNNN